MNKIYIDLNMDHRITTHYIFIVEGRDSRELNKRPFKLALL